MKISKLENHRLVIFPYPTVSTRHLDVMNVLHRLEREIRQHCEAYGEMNIEFDDRKVCSFCGLDWEVDEENCVTDADSLIACHIKGLPGCCGEAQEEFFLDEFDTLDEKLIMIELIGRVEYDQAMKRAQSERDLEVIEDGMCEKCGCALDQNFECRGECLAETADRVLDELREKGGLS